MRSVQRITREALPLTGHLSDRVLTGEEVLLKVGRSGFGISYLPLNKAEWRAFPPSEESDPVQLIMDERAAVFAAYEDDRLIGTACVRTGEKGWAEVLDIRVDAPYRRTGAAGMLLDACDRFASVRGMRGLKVEASEANPALCQFCEHKGFVLHGLDRMALVYSATEKTKPLARRACALYFYRLCSRDNQE